MLREQVTPDVVSGPAHPEVTALAGRHRDVVTHEATGPAFASLDELTAAGMLAPSVLRGAGYEPADVPRPARRPQRPSSEPVASRAPLAQSSTDAARRAPPFAEGSLALAP